MFVFTSDLKISEESRRVGELVHTLIVACHKVK